VDTGVVWWVVATQDPAAGPHSHPPRRQPGWPVVAESVRVEQRPNDW
jgi:hypothetical protein